MFLVIGPLASSIPEYFPSHRMAWEYAFMKASTTLGGEFRIYARMERLECQPFSEPIGEPYP